jgi:hypothetical protein
MPKLTLCLKHLTATFWGCRQCFDEKSEKMAEELSLLAKSKKEGFAREALDEAESKRA